MATKKKSTQAKTAKTTKKTSTKKSSVKATRKSAPKAAVKSSSVSKQTAKATSVAAPKTEKKVEKKAKVFDRFKNLNVWNWAMAALHAAQGVAVIVLSQDRLFPVSTDYLTTDSLNADGTAPALVSATRHLFDVNLAYVVAAFFFMSAIAHLVIASVYRKRYEQNLEKGLNRARWYEYGVSASTMMLAIAMLSGVTDLSTLLLIFAGTMVMNLCGLIMEVHNQTTTKTNWLSYWVGTIAGLVPWIVVGYFLWAAGQYGEGKPPTFVYFIYGSIFIFFSSFALNMVMQYKKKGKWANYLYGEKAYMVLSLVAKSALAWQVFAGTLRP